MKSYNQADLSDDSLDSLLDSYQLLFKVVKPTWGGYFGPDDDWIAPWIIEKIRKREKERRQEELPRVYIEDDSLYHPPEDKEETEDKAERGITIIDIIQNNDY